MRQFAFVALMTISIFLGYLLIAIRSVEAQEDSSPACMAQTHPSYSCVMQTKAFGGSGDDSANTSASESTAQSSNEAHPGGLSLEAWKHEVFDARGMEMMFQMVSRFQKDAGEVFIADDLNYAKIFAGQRALQKKQAACSGISESQADDIIGNADRYMEDIDDYKAILIGYKSSYQEYRELEGDGNNYATILKLRHSGAAISSSLKVVAPLVEKMQNETCEQLSSTKGQSTISDEEAEKKAKAHDEAMISGWVACVKKAQAEDVDFPNKVIACNDKYPFIGNHNSPPPGYWDGWSAH